MPDYPMHRAKRCGATTRRKTECLAPAMRNGRCRMHGGKSRAGKQHGRYKHGEHTKAAINERRGLRDMMREARGLVETIHRPKVSVSIVGRNGTRVLTGDKLRHYLNEVEKRRAQLLDR